MISTFSIIDMGMVLRSTEPFGFDGISRRPSIRINAPVGAETAQVAVGLAAGKAGGALNVADLAHALGGGELRHFADRAIERGLARSVQRRLVDRDDRTVGLIVAARNARSGHDDRFERFRLFPRVGRRGNGLGQRRRNGQSAQGTAQQHGRHQAGRPAPEPQ